MQSSPNTSLAQILIIVITALAVFTIGLLAVTMGLQMIEPDQAPPTPTVDLASLPLTPFATATSILLATTTSPPPTATLAATFTPLPIVTSTPSPIPTDTPTPESTPTPTPTATASPTALPPTPYAGPWRNNGGDYTALRRPGILIDGNLGDWAGVPALALPFVQSGQENYSGPDDFAAAARLAWDDAYLYYAVEVRDDLHVQEMSGYSMYNGDSVELWLDTDLAADFDNNTITGDDFQIGFSPGNFTGGGAEAVVWYPQRRPDWNSQILITATPTDSGYVVEAAIPWAVLGVQPLPGFGLGFAVNASDNDSPGTAAQQTILMHTAGMVWGQPVSFSNLRFE